MRKTGRRLGTPAEFGEHMHSLLPNEDPNDEVEVEVLHGHRLVEGAKLYEGNGTSRARFVTTRRRAGDLDVKIVRVLKRVRAGDGQGENRALPADHGFDRSVPL